MLQRLAILIIVASLMCLGAVILLDRIPASPGWRSAYGEVDEGWRRTSTGWERLAPHLIVRSATDSAGPSTATPSPRWDFHPGWLVILQVACGALGFGLFPGRKSAHNQRSQTLF